MAREHAERVCGEFPCCGSAVPLAAELFVSAFPTFSFANDRIVLVRLGDELVWRELITAFSSATCDRKTTIIKSKKIIFNS